MLLVAYSEFLFIRIRKLKIKQCLKSYKQVINLKSCNLNNTYLKKNHYIKKSLLFNIL